MNKMDWMDMSLRDFQSALASSSPTPGGGTASAIALGQAAALTCMVADLTIGKEKWKDGWVCAEEAQLVAIKIFSQAGTLAIRNATLKAALVPFQTAELAYQLLEVLPDLAHKGNANAVSDVGVASLLASAAAKGALFNVDINIGSLPSEMIGDLDVKSKELLEKSRVLSKESLKIVRERLN